MIGVIDRPIVTRFYRPELDTLRFGAFLAVFLHHALPWTDVSGIPAPIRPYWQAVVEAGSFGVDLFFLLSSYLITSLLIRESERTGSIDLPAFYVRRALRIWPLYVAFLIVGAVIVPYGGWPAIGLWTGTFNWFGEGAPLAYAHLWSISVEEQFYLGWPLILRGLGIRRLALAACGLLIVAWVVRLLTIATSAGWNLNTFTRLDPIAVGALIAWRFRDGLPDLSNRVRVMLLACGMAVPVLAVGLWGRDGADALLTFPLATVGASCVLLALLSDHPPRWLVSLPLVFAGRISYGLYIYHVLCLHTAWSVLGTHGVKGLIVAPALALIGTLGIAALSYEMYEAPFLRLKDRFAAVPSRPV